MPHLLHTCVQPSPLLRHMKEYLGEGWKLDQSRVLSFLDYWFSVLAFSVGKPDTWFVANFGRLF